MQNSRSTEDIVKPVLLCSTEYSSRDNAIKFTLHLPDKSSSLEMYLEVTFSYTLKWPHED